MRTIECQGSTQIGNKDVKSNFTFIIADDVVDLLLENECKVRSRAGEGKTHIAKAGDGGNVTVQFTREGDSVKRTFVDRKAMRQAELMEIIKTGSPEEMIQAATELKALLIN